MDQYPLKYEDGRISSTGTQETVPMIYPHCLPTDHVLHTPTGQQVTGYPFHPLNDTNNHWIVEPTKEIPETGRGRIVRHRDVIRLRHVATNTTLLTHDVACPTMATNTEFTTWDGLDESRESDTHFTIEIEDAHAGQQWMSKSSFFKLIHVNTKVAMWSHVDPPLPDWGYKQQEINGNKNVKDRSTLWIVDEIIKDPSESKLWVG